MRRVLVTGANKGIGLATVRKILDHADDTFVYLGSRSEERGRAAVESLDSDRVRLLVIDVSDDASVAAAAEQVDELYGIVNNAGLMTSDMRATLEVNTYGPKRVVDAFGPKLAKDGRIVNVASASGPNFVSKCSADKQALLTDPAITWDGIAAVIDECLALEGTGGFGAAGYGEGNAYGLSKALLNAYTLLLARTMPERTVNACTPGWIATDMTARWASGQAAIDAGMKTPAEGTRSTMHLLFGDVGASGWYFGSDAVRSPLHKYRSPGDPPYDGN